VLLFKFLWWGGIHIHVVRTNKKKKLGKLNWSKSNSLKTNIRNTFLWKNTALKASRPCSFSSKQVIDIPMSLGFALVAVGVLQGLSLGAVFVYHSSVVRSLVAAMVIVLLAVEHRVYSVEIVSGIGLVVFGVIGWLY